MKRCYRLIYSLYNMEHVSERSEILIGTFHFIFLFNCQLQANAFLLWNLPVQISKIFSGTARRGTDFNFFVVGAA